MIRKSFSIDTLNEAKLRAIAKKECRSESSLIRQFITNGIKNYLGKR